MGLLDMLGGLSPEQTQGLLAAAAQISEASGPARVKPNVMGALAQGGLAYSQSTEQARQRKLMEERQAQQDAMANEYRTAQMEGVKGQQQSREAEAQRRAGMMKAAQESIVDGQLNPQLYAQKLAQYDPEQAIDLMKQSAPKPVTYGQPKEFLVNGKPAVVVVDSEGKPKVLDGYSPYEAPKVSARVGGSGGSVVGAARGTIAAAADKPLPATALKMLVSEEDALGTAGNIKTRLSSISAQIDGGTLDFGPMRNVKNQALNMMGTSTEESRNFASFKSTLEKLRNDSLRLNAGVQTDGDAQRAWNELFANITDKEYVKQRLKEIDGYNDEAVSQRQKNIGIINGNYGRQAAPAAATPGVTTVPNPIAPVKKAPNVPLKGQVKNGYRFKGGNPADPSAWEKI